MPANLVAGALQAPPELAVLVQEVAGRSVDRSQLAVCADEPRHRERDLEELLDVRQDGDDVQASEVRSSWPMPSLSTSTVKRRFTDAIVPCL